LRPTTDRLKVATWNVEGLTEAKLVQLQIHMTKRSIDVLCVQETHITKSEYRVLDDGFLLILSGRQDDEREYAGVGFLVSPHMRRSVIGFCQLSRRIAYLKLRVSGGKMVVFSAYAPHGRKPFEERQTFFTELHDAFNSTSSHGIKVIGGDLNARLHKRLAGEEAMLGEFVLGNPARVLEPGTNRELLMELCSSTSLVVANTLCEVPRERQITYYDIGATPASEFSHKNFTAIDFVLVPRDMQRSIGPVVSDRGAALTTHHFLVETMIDVAVEKQRPRVGTGHKDVAALRSPAVAQKFADEFAKLIGTADATADVSEACGQICNACSRAAQAALQERSVQARRPWISSFFLIVLRNTARIPLHRCRMIHGLRSDRQHKSKRGTERLSRWSHSASREQASAHGPAKRVKAGRRRRARYRMAAQPRGAGCRKHACTMRALRRARAMPTAARTRARSGRWSARPCRRAALRQMAWSTAVVSGCSRP